MQTLDHDRIFKLGHWLEEFFEPKLDISNFNKLARSAVDLLNINYDFKKHDITGVLIDFITATEEWKKVPSRYCLI